MNLSKKGERIRDELISHGGLNADEIDVLFKSEEELIQYYEAQNSAKSVEITEDDSEDGPEPEDDYKLSPEAERAVTESENARRLEEMRQKHNEHVSASESEKPKADFDDFLKSITDGMTSDDSNVPNN